MFYLTNCGSVSGYKGPDEAELRALLRALTFAQQAKLFNILILTDWLSLASFLTSKIDYILWYNISLVVFCKEFFCNINTSVGWVQRSLNMTAHNRIYFKILKLS